MRFTDLFIKRPVLAIVVNLVIVIAGLQAFRSLNVRQYPKLESATITVRTPYVGANAELVRGFREERFHDRVLLRAAGSPLPSVADATTRQRHAHKEFPWTPAS